MLALKITFFSVAIPTLLVSISILIGVILYRRLLSRMGKDEIDQAKYATLEAITRQPASGEVEFFYELHEDKEVEIFLLDEKMNEIKSIDKRSAKAGGNKVKFDTTSVPNARYFFELRSDNQKTAKTLIVKNEG